MADVHDRSTRSYNMARVRSSGCASTEARLVELLRQHRVTGWRRNYKMFGKPDLVFPRNRLVIFVDGCFWHGCRLHRRLPASNREFWRKKINDNRRRDRLVTGHLIQAGWKVVRFWEHSLRYPNAAMARLRRHLAASSLTTTER